MSDDADTKGSRNSPLQRAREAVKFALAPAADDLPAVDYCLSISLSTSFTSNTDPLWGWLIGPPGSMKTELLRGFKNHEHVYFLSTLTPQSLISGFETTTGQDPSILPQLDQKLLVVKDFTSIMGLPDKDTRTIFGDLRGIYDGFHSKGFGTVGRRSYSSRFSMLAAATPAVDQYTTSHAELGERFLALRIGRVRQDTCERLRQIRHVWKAASTKSTWRGVLSNALDEAVKAVQQHDAHEVNIRDEYLEKLYSLADLLSVLRSLPDIQSQAHATFTPTDPEIASRTIQQLAGLGCGRAILDGRLELNDKDILFLRRVMWDSLATPIFTLVKALTRAYPHSIHRLALSKKTGLIQGWVIKAIRQYQHAGIVWIKGENEIRLTDYAANTLKSKEADRRMNVAPQAKSPQSPSQQQQQQEVADAS